MAKLFPSSSPTRDLSSPPRHGDNVAVHLNGEWDLQFVATEVRHPEKLVCDIRVVLKHKGILRKVWTIILFEKFNCPFIQFPFISPIHSFP